MITDGMILNKDSELLLRLMKQAYHGDVTISSDTAIPRNIMFYDNLIINEGVSLYADKLQPYFIFVKNTLDIDGTLKNRYGAFGGTGGSAKAGDGGQGGGILCVVAKNIIGTGQIDVNGNAGSNGGGTADSANLDGYYGMRGGFGIYNVLNLTTTTNGLYEGVDYAGGGEPGLKVSYNSKGLGGAAHAMASFVTSYYNPLSMLLRPEVYVHAISGTTVYSESSSMCKIFGGSGGGEGSASINSSGFANGGGGGGSFAAGGNGGAAGNASYYPGNAGGGGGGAGLLSIIADNIESGIKAYSVGGNGGNGGYTHAGGGGGGAGGRVTVLSPDASNLSISVAGGSGGTKAGSASNGSAGSAGNSELLSVISGFF